MYDTTSLDTEAAFARYEAIRRRLPSSTFPTQSRQAPTLTEVSASYDGFVLDAFGVLNVGNTAIPGAVARMAELRAMGKALIVLTNAASYTRAAAAERYRGFGFDFTLDEIVSSRDVTSAHLEEVAPGIHWAAISTGADGFEDIPAEVSELLPDSGLWETADGFLFLSSQQWTAALQDRLVEALNARPRPVVIANPDLVAPRESGLSVEPGFWGHDIADRTRVVPRFFGKPYAEAFTIARARSGAERLAMVGDTLHTDILGGGAAGMGTVLITRHGLFAGHETSGFVARSGIVPDWSVETT